MYRLQAYISCRCNAPCDSDRFTLAILQCIFSFLGQLVACYNYRQISAVFIRYFLQRHLSFVQLTFHITTVGCQFIPATCYKVTLNLFHSSILVLYIARWNLFILVSCCISFILSGHLVFCYYMQAVYFATTCHCVIFQSVNSLFLRILGLGLGDISFFRSDRFYL